MQIKIINKLNYITDKINFNELSYDCALLIFPFLIGKMYHRIIQSHVFGLPFSQLFLLAAVYFLPVLIGRMYCNIFSNSSPVIKKLVLTILFTVTIFAYGNLVYLIMSAGGEITVRGIFIFLAATVLLIMGPIAGLAFQNDDIENKNYPVQIIIFLFTIGILPLFYMLITSKEIFGDINDILLFIVAMILCVLDAILIIALTLGFLGLRNLLMRTKIYDFITISLKLFIPFSVSFILVFFNIYTDRIFIGTGSIHDPGSIIMLTLMYTFTGVLPLRILMMLAPPVRWINVIIGILSVSLMIWYTSLN